MEDHLQCTNSACGNFEAKGRWLDPKWFAGTDKQGRAFTYRTCAYCRKIDSEKKRNKRVKAVVAQADSQRRISELELMLLQVKEELAEARGGMQILQTQVGSLRSENEKLREMAMQSGLAPPKALAEPSSEGLHFKPAPKVVPQTRALAPQEAPLVQEMAMQVERPGPHVPQAHAAMPPDIFDNDSLSFSDFEQDESDIEECHLAKATCSVPGSGSGSGSASGIQYSDGDMFKPHGGGGELEVHQLLSTFLPPKRKQPESAIVVQHSNSCHGPDGKGKAPRICMGYSPACDAPVRRHISPRRKWIEDTTRIEMDELDMDRLRIAKTTTTRRIVESEATELCCICIDQMKVNTQVRTLLCGHYFHTRCVDKWLKVNKSCPICKVPIDSLEPEPEPQPLSLLPSEQCL